MKIFLQKKVFIMSFITVSLPCKWAVFCYGKVEKKGPWGNMPKTIREKFADYGKNFDFPFQLSKNMVKL